MVLIQLNTTVNSTSTGRIAEDIGRALIDSGHTSYIAYGVQARESWSNLISISNSWDQKLHGLQTRILDRHGFGSKAVTRKFVEKLDLIDPDIIHFHNLHGYYLHIGVLFRYLSERKKPVIWTFHDSWPFTGHCTFFDHYDCEKWKNQCRNCPNVKGYPASWGIDQSKRNYEDKKRLFNAVNNLTIVTPSHWLADLVKQSFLKSYNLRVINNGVDLEQFYPHLEIELQNKRIELGIKNNRVILGVASIWDKRKGLSDFIYLSRLLDENSVIILVGLDSKQLQSLPKTDRILGIARTESIKELSCLYALADVFVNPTYLDNFPNTNIEALACGTPVITYKTGGSPEAVGYGCGFVVEQGNLDELEKRIDEVLRQGKDHYRDRCRKRAEALYDKNDRYQDYLDLYQEVLEKS